MTALEAGLQEVTAALESLSIPYMLIGGLAVSLWGEPRATLDLDLTIWVEPQDLERTISQLCQRLRALPADPLAFVQQTRVLPVETSQEVRADLIFGALPYEKQAIVRAQPKQVAGKAVLVASVEDLLLMKLASERQKDFEDAQRLVRRYQGSLDLSYLEPRLKELAEALGRSDILEMLGKMSS
jgi:hypothetical protein